MSCLLWWQIVKSPISETKFENWLLVICCALIVTVILGLVWEAIVRFFTEDLPPEFYDPPAHASKGKVLGDSTLVQRNRVAAAASS